MKSTMPMPQPQPIRAMPPTGQRYGQVPPVPRPSSNYSLPLAPQSTQQQQYANRPAYNANSYQQQLQQQQQPSQYQGSYQQNQSSYQRKSY
jgi:hypothetical protein